MANEIENPVGITEQGRKLRHDPVTIYWESGDTSSKLSNDIQMTSAAADTQAFTNFTRTITGLGSTNTAGRLRISATSGLAGGGQRNFIPITGSSCKDSEIRSLWYGHTQVGSNQMGHVHRIQSNGSGFQWGFITWHDVIFSTDSVLNTGIWTGKTPTAGDNADMTIHFSTNTPTTEDVPGIQPYFTLEAASHTGTTVTLITQLTHTAQVGDYVKAVGTEISDVAGVAEIGQVTAVSDNTITYTSTINRGFTPLYSTDGKVLIISRVMPYWVCSQLVGGVFRVKAWPQEASEPNWSDPRYAFRVDAFPITGPPAGTAGLCGIYAGHLAVPGTNWVEYGSVTWRSLD